MTAPEGRGALLVYRGPWQGRRLDFIVNSLMEVHDDLEMIWLDPDHRRRVADGVDHLEFRGRLQRGADLRAFEVMDGRTARLPAAWRVLRRRRRVAVVHAVGFSTLTYARAVPHRQLGWFINGIPEERLLYRQSPRARVAARTSWLVARLGKRPDLAVVVSSRMARLVERRLPGTVTAVAPTCPRLDRFHPPADADRRFVTYLGSGAPWQGLDTVAAIWSAMAELDDRVRFRVISRDARAKVLTAGVPSERIEVVGTNDPDDVARMLWQADIGFLVRAPDLVNEVSFPTKFGEYVAAGVPVVLSDLDWDLSDIARETDCALLVSPDSSTADVAKASLAYLDRVHAEPQIRERCQVAAQQLSYDHWRERLVSALRAHLADRRPDARRGLD